VGKAREETPKPNEDLKKGRPRGNHPRQRESSLEERTRGKVGGSKKKGLVISGKLTDTATALEYW